MSATNNTTGLGLVFVGIIVLWVAITGKLDVFVKFLRDLAKPPGDPSVASVGPSVTGGNPDPTGLGRNRSGAERVGPDGKI